ncbi:MAG TPA: IS30 family transposase, partial [Rhizomicrobium sp.]|nr:IS30 family transposase [Rhizomicrobium sp.]
CFSKGTNLSMYPRTHLSKVARQLNERPRKILGVKSPEERFTAGVASIG